MNKKLAQLAYFVNRIDRRYLQFTYFVLILAVGVLVQPCPADGGGGPV